MLEIMINDTKVILEKRNGDIVTIECFDQEKAERMAKDIAVEIMGFEK